MGQQESPHMRLGCKLPSEGVDVCGSRPSLAAWPQTSWLWRKHPVLNRTEMTLGSLWSRGSDLPGGWVEIRRVERTGSCFGRRCSSGYIGKGPRVHLGRFKAKRYRSELPWSFLH